MIKKVKITVIRKVSHADLSALYENPMEHACDMQEGQTFISVDNQKPEEMCESAWQSMMPFVMTLAHGGGNFYNMISCNDGFRPVSFLIETIE